MTRMVRRLLLIVLFSLVFFTVALSQSRVKEPELATLLERAGERVKTYYLDLQKLAWTDAVKQQSLKDDRTPLGNARNLVYDMIIRLSPAVLSPGTPPPAPPFHTKDLGELISVDGTPVQKGDRPESIDPKPGDIGLLWILMWAPKREDGNYRFSYAGQTNMAGRKTLMVDITYPPRGFPVGHFDVAKSGDSNRVPRVVREGEYFSVWVEQTGRIWIDGDTYDVLRLETRTKPFEFENPNGGSKLKFEFELSARFQPWMFENPKEMLMVPESVETIRTIKGMQPAVVRTIHTFANYKRFGANVTIIPTETR